jgi:hypothetical protein
MQMVKVKPQKLKAFSMALLRNNSNFRKEQPPPEKNGVKTCAV